MDGGRELNKNRIISNPNAFWQLAATQGITAEMLQALDEVSETMDGSGLEENPLIARQLDLITSPDSLETLKEFDSWDMTHGQQERKQEDFESGSSSLKRRSKENRLHQKRLRNDNRKAAATMNHKHSREAERLAVDIQSRFPIVIHAHITTFTDIETGSKIPVIEVKIDANADERDLERFIIQALSDSYGVRAKSCWQWLTYDIVRLPYLRDQTRT